MPDTTQAILIRDIIVSAAKPTVTVSQTPPATAAPKPTASTAKPSVLKSSLSIYKGNSEFLR